MKKIIILFATGFGTGLSPIIPGTMGTILGVFLTLFIKFNLFSIILISVLGIYICNEAEKIMNQHDPSKVVIDEIAGFLIASYLVPLNMLFISFVAFRFFDMVKPYPINKLQELPGGFGIMADDIVAGLLSNLLVQGLLLFFH